MAGIKQLLNKNSIFNAITNVDHLWSMGIIPFVIDKDLEDKRNLIVDAMDQYHQYTCIRFVERTNQYDYIYLAKMSGCYSYVGRVGGKQLVSLSNGCHNIATIVHELGHAIGFYHEHQRTDRNKFIDIYPDNVMDGYMDQFNMLDNSRLLVPFDFYSVMLYGPLTFSKDGRSETMLPNARHRDHYKMIEVFQKYGLSETDIQAIKHLYQC